MKCELFNDHFQNFRSYQIPKAQLVIADIPYNVGNNAYASNPSWYIAGKHANGESEKAGKQFFYTDNDFRIPEFMHFCSHMLKKEPKESGQAPCMIVFCAFEQIPTVIDCALQYGFVHYIPLTFIKNFSPQALKSNMKIVGATEYAIMLYRDKLPKFNNHGKMIFNWLEWRKDGSIPRIHPNQKPISVLKRLIEIFTDVGDVVIDPVAGSGITLRACAEMNRNAYGFEIDKDMFKKACDIMLKNIPQSFLYMKGVVNDD